MGVTPDEVKQIYANHHDANSILMVIDKSASFFYFIDGGEQLISLPVGYEDISARFFRHTPPTPDDIEYAINYIEDEIEKVVPKIPHTFFYVVRMILSDRSVNYAELKIYHCRHYREINSKSFSDNMPRSPWGDRLALMKQMLRLASMPGC